MANLMSLSFLSVLLYVNSGSGALNSGCAGGYENGQSYDDGMFWYQCQNGVRINKGCIGSDKQRTPIGGSFVRGEFLLGCVENGKFLDTVYRGCVVNQQPKAVGSEWTVSDTYFKCVTDGTSVRVEVSGCIDDGRKVELESEIPKDKYVYKCRKSGAGRVEFSKVGCVHEGRSYKIGEAITGSKVWYVCTYKGADVSGCMYNGQKMKDGDHYNNFQEGVAYACFVSDVEAGFKPFACVGPENVPVVDRKPGCTWTDDDTEYTCKESGGKITKVPTACVYHGSQGMLKIAPGCIQQAGTIAIGCVGTSKLTTQTFSADQMSSSGLRQC